MSSVTTELLLILLLLLINGLLAMSEMAIVSARRTRLQQRAAAGDAGAAAALDLAREPTRFLSTVQIGITLVGILAGAFGGATIAAAIRQALEPIPVLAAYAEAIGLAVVVAAITFLSLIVGELVPKRLALNAPERVAMLVARPMRLLAWLANPVVLLLTLTTDGVVRVLGVKPSEEAAITEEEVRVLIAQGTEAGVFEAAERELVESAFELGDAQVRDLMTPRPLIDWLDLDDPPEVQWQALAELPHLHVPLCRGQLDNVLGILEVRQVVGELLAGRRPDLASLAREPMFVPEHLPVFKALAQFRQASPHVALVIDEHGGVAGLLSLVDVLKALVGDLAQLPGTSVSRPVQRDDGSWLLDGLALVDDVADLLQLGAASADEDEDVQTLGGMAQAILGRVPRPGDAFVWRGRRFEILDMDGRRVDKLLALPQVTAPPPSTADKPSTR
jgi:putative hemolysin